MMNMKKGLFNWWKVKPIHFHNQIRKSKWDDIKLVKKQQFLRIMFNQDDEKFSP